MQMSAIGVSKSEFFGTASVMLSMKVNVFPDQSEPYMLTCLRPNFFVNSQPQSVAPRLILFMCSGYMGSSTIIWIYFMLFGSLIHMPTVLVMH